MSTPQLVGRDCVICGQRIGAIDEGDFCSACSCPVHFDCWKATPSLLSGNCPTCGAPAHLLAARQEQLQAEMAEIASNARARRAYSTIGVGLSTIGAGAFMALRGGLIGLVISILIGLPIIVVGMIRLLRR